MIAAIPQRGRAVINTDCTDFDSGKKLPTLVHTCRIAKDEGDPSSMDSEAVTDICVFMTSWPRQRLDLQVIPTHRPTFRISIKPSLRSAMPLCPDSPPLRNNSPRPCPRIYDTNG